ncbi:MAG: T9SS type A sorting domain-containing protein [Bacteroidales bacterium]|nr:T9SS type A sorting domain-containing protein [Bacteroidales bacterium]
MLAISFRLDAQITEVTILEDNFDSYTAGNYLAQQSSLWTTWSDAPGTAEDAYVSDDQAYSTPNSVIIDAPTNMGTQDLVLPLGNLTSGHYKLSFQVFVATGKGGYFNMQHDETPGIEWSWEMYFSSAGTYKLYAAGDSADGTFTNGQWNLLEIDMDLNQDLATMIFAGDTVFAWQFSLKTDGTAGMKKIGGMDYFSYAPGTDLVEYYIDDVLFVRYDYTGIEQQSPLNISVYPNPTKGMLYLDGVTADEVIVIDFAGNELLYAKGDITSVDLSNTSKGVCFVKIVVDGIVTVKRIMLL